MQSGRRDPAAPLERQHVQLARHNALPDSLAARGDHGRPQRGLWPQQVAPKQPLPAQYLAC
jgi:hypothetical protein